MRIPFQHSMVPIRWYHAVRGNVLMLGVVSFFTDVSSLLKICSGRLSDTLGQRKYIAVAGYGISTLCRPMMALATGGWHVVALRFGDRVGKGIRTPARDALISESTDSGTRGLAFSFHRAMDHAGAVLPVPGHRHAIRPGQQLRSVHRKEEHRRQENCDEVPITYSHDIVDIITRNRGNAGCQPKTSTTYT